MKIIVAEDNRASAALLPVNFFPKEGYFVINAENGNEAWEKVEFERRKNIADRLDDAGAQRYRTLQQDKKR